MRNTALALLALLAPVAVTAPAAVNAAPAGDVSAVRTVIERQFSALRQADARLALGMVAPQLRGQFTSEAAYLTSVRSTLPFMTEARGLTFGAFRETSAGMAQMVQVTDRRGEPWMAFFIMQKGAKGRWHIANVVAVKLPTMEA